MEFAVTAIGRDRPGIVAAISGALFELGGNIEDSQMSILRGHFAVMLIVGLSGETDPGRLEGRLKEVAQELNLEAVTVSALDDVAGPLARPSHVLSVYGADRPGIVHGVASALAQLGVNITNLETRLSGGPGSPLYVMLLEVSLGDTPSEDVDAALAEVAARSEVDVSLRPLETDAL